MIGATVLKISKIEKIEIKNLIYVNIISKSTNIEI